MSGGRATVHSKTKVTPLLRRQAGDISAVSAEGCPLVDRYYIECKHLKSLDIPAFVLKRKGILAAFWQETMKQAAHYDRQPMLIAKQNLYPTIVVTRPEHLMCQAIATFDTWCAIGLWDEMLKTPYKL